MADPTPLRRRQAAQTRALVLDAAARVFARHGYAEATIDRVAAEAGASKGAVYHHFAGKAALFEALMAERAAGLGPLRELAAGADSLGDLIGGLVESWTDRIERDADGMSLALEARTRALRDRSAAALLNVYHDELRAAVAAVLEAAGRFGGTPPRRAGMVGHALLDGITQQWALSGAPVEELRPALRDGLLDLLGVRR